MAQEIVRNSNAHAHSFSLSLDANICNLSLKVSTAARNIVRIIANTGSQYQINTQIIKIKIAESSVVNQDFHNTNAQ